MPLTEIGSHNAQDFLDAISKAGYSRGLVPRNYRARPPGYEEAMPTFPDELLIPMDKAQAMLDYQIAHLSSLYELRNAYYDTLRSLNQNGKGLCWFFSGTKALMYARVRSGDPPAILSAWWGAGKVKGWRDQGGSGDEGCAFLAKYGVPTMDKCPGYNSKYDSPEVAADALNHRIAQWYDGSNDRNKNVQIMVTAAVMGWSWVGDYNWLGHSMAGNRVLSINPLVTDDDNSWDAIDQYGEKGLYRLTGAHAVPDNICVCVASVPSVV